MLPRHYYSGQHYQQKMCESGGRNPLAYSKKYFSSGKGGLDAAAEARASKSFLCCAIIKANY
jgi:hypothetical protein